MRERSRAAGPQDEPYYPVNTPEDRRRLLAYRELVGGERDLGVVFGGRLGASLYLVLHMAIATALRLVADLASVVHGPPRTSREQQVRAAAGASR